MLLFDVTLNFDKACASLLANEPEVLTFVKNHERKTLVLNNLCSQVLQFERRYGGKATLGKRNELILATARMFVDAAREAHRQKMWSDAEKRRQESKAQPFDDMKEVLKDGGGKVFTNGVLTEVD